MLIVRDLQTRLIREIRLIRCGQFDTPSSFVSANIRHSRQLLHHLLGSHQALLTCHHILHIHLSLC